MVISNPHDLLITQLECGFGSLACVGCLVDTYIHSYFPVYALIAVIQSYKTVEEAIKFANRMKYNLSQ
jgi:hypothetical protein